MLQKSPKFFFLIKHYDFLSQAEARAEFAEKTVKKLQKEVDRLEGKCYGSILNKTTVTQYNIRIIINILLLV